MMKRRNVRVMASVGLLVFTILIISSCIPSMAHNRSKSNKRNKTNHERKFKTSKPVSTPSSTSKPVKTPSSTSSPVNPASDSTSDGIGYKAVENSKDSIDSNAIICSSSNELSQAINGAKAGSVIYVKAGNYANCKLNIEVAGSADKYIKIMAYPGDKVTFANSTIEFASSAKYIIFKDFVIKDYTPNDDWGTCVSFAGGSSYIEFKNNEISNIKCKGSGEVGVNPLVLYGDSSSSINNILIENCYIHDCNTGWSEALTTDGNVENCIIRNCTINNTNNIGIDLAGNFSWTGSVGDKNNQSRNILVTKNLVMNCNSPYATSAGLYCDGGRDNTFSYNIVYNSQCGIELGAEEPGADVCGFKIEHNTIVNCGRAIGAGAYLATGANHYDTTVTDNTIICNQANKWGDNAAIFLERTKNFVFKNNIVYLKNKATQFIEGNSEATYTLDANTWFIEGGAGEKPSQDKSGVFKNPNIANLNDMLAGKF